MALNGTILLTKNDAQLESCKLNFVFFFFFFLICGTMRTAARETAPQTALRDCSKEALGKVNI